MSDSSQSAGAGENASQSEEASAVETNESTQQNSEQSLDAQELSINTDPNMSKQEKVEAKKMLKSLKIKFNGREYDEELPFEIPDDESSIEYMRNTLQMKKLAQTKAQEASQMQKEVINFLSELRKNPAKVLSDPKYGVDIKKLAASVIEDEIENAKKSPEQVEKEKIEKELKELKSQVEKEKEENKTREFERLQQQEYERYDVLMTQALDKSDLPKSPYVVKKIADYMLLGLQQNMDITPEDVLPLVREEMSVDLKEMFAAMPEEIVEQLIGTDTIDRIRKKRLQKAKVAPKPLNKSITDAGVEKKETKDSKNAKKVNMKDFFGI